jgi:hypothetical protein
MLNLNETMIKLVRGSSAVRWLFVRLAGTVGRQSALHKENSGFAAQLWVGTLYSSVTPLSEGKMVMNE